MWFGTEHTVCAWNRNLLWAFPLHVVFAFLIPRESIKKIIAIEDKASWFESMRPILEHNYENLKKNATKINPAVIRVEQAYNKYFKLGKT
jgi:hypothetical protein